MLAWRSGEECCKSHACLLAARRLGLGLTIRSKPGLVDLPLLLIIAADFEHDIKRPILIIHLATAIKPLLELTC